MNSRVKELAEEAGYLPDMFGRGHWDMPECIKFAELIVRECVRYINKDYQRDFDTLWREDLTKSIKEHFGVE